MNPSGQIMRVPAPHGVMSHATVPTFVTPHSCVQCAPASHSVVQGALEQTTWHVLPAAQCTRHGAVVHENVHELF